MPRRRSSSSNGNVRRSCRMSATWSATGATKTLSKSNASRFSPRSRARSGKRSPMFSSVTAAARSNGIHGDAERFDPGCEVGRDVPRHLVAEGDQSLGDRGQGADVTRERHGRDEDLHDARSDTRHALGFGPGRSRIGRPATSHSLSNAHILLAPRRRCSRACTSAAHARSCDATRGCVRDLRRTLEG